MPKTLTINYGPLSVDIPAHPDCVMCRSDGTDGPSACGAVVVMLIAGFALSRLVGDLCDEHREACQAAALLMMQG